METTEGYQGSEHVSPDQLEQEAQRALAERPSLSIRAKLMIGFLLFFILCGALIVTTITTLNTLDAKTKSLVIADRYTAEVQQARRLEKNFFLYGTNLDDVLHHIETARSLKESSEPEMKAVFGEETLTVLSQHLEHYLSLLNRLKEMDAARPPDQLPRYPEIEEELRSHGSFMVKSALELSDRERRKVRLIFKWTKRMPLVFLVFLLILAIYEANVISRQIIGRLTRLMNLTSRIADGDFTPIMPERRYRDEFSNVNIALNRMMHELNRRQELMIQSHKLRAIGTLTAGIAHELNNPINNIILTAAALEEDWGDLSEAEKLELAADLVSQAERSERIIKNLLEFARESEIRTEHLDLHSLIGETVKLASNEIKLRKVKVEMDLGENLPFIHGDRQQLSQVLLNLILNALDAMEERGTLRIKADRAATPGFVDIRVQDTGCGIPPHILPLIFDPFFTTKPTGRGTGLGLSVSQGIIKKHGGDLTVRSEPGAGTEFTVLLPIAEVPAEMR